MNESEMIKDKMIKDKMIKDKMIKGIMIKSKKNKDKLRVDCCPYHYYSCLYRLFNIHSINLTIVRVN